MTHLGDTLHILLPTRLVRYQRQMRPEAARALRASRKRIRAEAAEKAAPHRAVFSHVQGADDPFGPAVVVFRVMPK